MYHFIELVDDFKYKEKKCQKKKGNDSIVGRVVGSKYCHVNCLMDQSGRHRDLYPVYLFEPGWYGPNYFRSRGGIQR